MRNRGWYPIFAVLTLAVMATNILGFIEIEKNNTYAEAIDRDGRVPHLQEIALGARDEVMGGAFHLPSIVHVLGPDRGARVTGFEGDGIRDDVFRGLGVLSRYEIGDHDPKLPAREREELQAWVVMKGRDRNAGEFVVAARNPPVRHFVLHRSSGVLYVVDSRLLDSGS